MTYDIVFQLIVYIIQSAVVFGFFAGLLLAFFARK